MRGMPFHLQEVQGGGGGGLEEEANFWSNRRKKRGAEPNSVLDKRSPSSPTSTSTLSSSHSHQLGPTSSPGDVGPTLTPPPPAAKWPEDWDSIAAEPDQDHTFLHWMMGDEVSGGNAEADFGLNETILPIIPNNAVFFDQNLTLNHHHHLPPPQNPPFLLNLPQFHPPHFFSPPQNPTQFESIKANPSPSAHDELLDALFRASELVESGNPVSAREILARLNHHLPSPIGKPLLRSAFYFKNALQLLTTNTPPTSPLSTPLDVLLKLGTYKAFSELSPILQFTNFTSVQAILEELDGCNRIHIIDFDIGVGGHWSSFIQELAHRGSPSLRITAFASHSSHHPLELHLTKENLSHFASDLNVPFEFNVLTLDSFDAMSLASDEAVAVNFPVGSGVSCESAPAVLRIVKQLSPRIVVSVDHGCGRSDLRFSHHFLHAFRACTVLLDSIDASGANPDVANKIERYMVQPRIENMVLGRKGEKMLPWNTMFTSAGFNPIQFSNFTETQAECLLKRVQVRGFQVEKREASLLLSWQQGELVSVSAWR